MKVLFCDPLNTQNCFYVCAKHLRQVGVDAHVAVDSSSTPTEHLPSWHDQNVALASPDWIHYLRLPYFVPYKNPLRYLSLLKELVDFARGFDVVVCAGLAPIWMRWTGKPFIFSTYGADLDELAVRGWSGVIEHPISLEKRVLHYLIRHHLTGSLRKASATILMPHQSKTAKSVGLSNLHFLPHIIDTQRFRPLENEQRQQAKQAMHDNLECDLIMFHPPRQNWVDKSAPDRKGNDKVFRAFARFLRVYDGRAKLLVAKKGWDVEASLRLVHKLGISESVVWLDPVPRTEMCRLYNSVGIVLDQFAIGVVGSIAIEAMACGTPVITYVASNVKRLLYPKMPPVCNVYNENEIYLSMCFLARDRTALDTSGREGREWVEAYCGPEITSARYIKLFRQVLGKGKKGAA